VITTRATQVPDATPPTGTITGPRSLTVGQFGKYTVGASDNAGGSGIDPASFAWSATRVGCTQTGTTATFAFSTPGTHVVTASFKDIGGNASTATLTVNVAVPAPTGTSPTSQSTGGGTVTAFKRVTVTGHGRFIPVKVASKPGRTFVLTLLTVKGHHHVVPAVKATLRKGGKKTVNIGLNSKVKTGKYLLVVRVFNLAGKGTGRQITFAFVLV